MDINGSGSQTWPLTTGNNDNPSLTQGSPTSFFCNTVPDRAPGGLAYYLPYVLLTITGNVVQSGTAGSVIAYDVLRQCLIDSIDWITTWFGTALSANHVKGTYLPIVEFVSGGFSYASRQWEPIAATAGTYPFRMTIAVPAASCLVGDLGGNTSQLALLFQTSQIKINVAGSSVIAAVSAGATLTSLAARCSAKLVPSAELILGTPVEWIMEQTVAGANSPQVQIRGFGTDTLMNGVEKKGGVVWLGELTSLNNQLGVFSADHVTSFTNPWRNQQLTYHPESIVADMLQSMRPRSPQTLPAVLTGGDSEQASYPYQAVQGNAPATTNTTGEMRKGLLFWPIGAHPSSDLQLTNLQTADKDESYFLGLDTTFSAGSHLVLGAYARQWTRDMQMNWLGQVSKGGSASLAAHVLGSNWQGAVSRAQSNGRLAVRVPRKRHVTTADQMTYLAHQLA